MSMVSSEIETMRYSLDCIEARKVIHYELFFFYIAGYRPRDVIKDFGYSRGTAYRFYHIYREAGKRARGVIDSRNSVSPRREKKLNREAY